MMIAQWATILARADDAGGYRRASSELAQSLHLEQTQRGKATRSNG
jgi:hypothetical protein